MFRWFRPLEAAVQGLAEQVGELARVQGDAGPALDRLESLERFRHQFEAECEGLLLKADGKLKAAASAEQRERQLKKTNTQLAAQLPDPFPEVGEEGTERAAVFPIHAAGGEAPGVPPVRLALATNSKAHAVRAKFGV